MPEDDTTELGEVALLLNRYMLEQRGVALDEAPGDAPDLCAYLIADLLKIAHRSGWNVADVMKTALDEYLGWGRGQPPR